MFNQDLYKVPYHETDLSNYSFLVTGGAGFIGSNIVEYLLKFNAGKVRVLDNLSNGYFDNIKDFLPLSNFEFINGDIRDIDTCKKAVEGIDFVTHQAALGSVPRSIADPIMSNDVNIGGFLNMLVAVKDHGMTRKFVYAASSSTYGDHPDLPKIEGKEGKPLSPYAVTKAVNEMYADVFSNIYGIHSIGLRYFNIFGPKQNPNNPYAAVIPIFCKSFIQNEEPTIFGDGNTSRDFTFIENAVQANILALLSKSSPKHKVYNVACGDQTTLNEMVEYLKIISGKIINVQYVEERLGDVKHSKASINKLKSTFNYNPKFNFKTGLEIVYNWYKCMYEN
jgi:UDP-N-acetylglucosamine 4-epimerase